MRAITFRSTETTKGTYLDKHHVMSHIGNGKSHLILKGVLAPRNLTNNDKTQKQNIRIVLEIQLEQLPEGSAFLIEQWAPLLTINGWSTTDISRQFGIEVRWTKLRNVLSTPTQVAMVESELYLCNAQSHIHQIGYHIDLIGILVDS